MRTHSFRFRLAIFSAMVTGVIVLAFGVAAWVFVYKNLLKSVDSRLHGPIERMVRRVHEGRDWVRFGEGMRFFGREFEQETVTMVMSNATGMRLFASERSSWMGETETFRSHLPTPEVLASAPSPPTPVDQREPLPRGSDSAAAESAAKSARASERASARGRRGRAGDGAQVT